eukprot:s1529_g15.t1
MAAASAVISTPAPTAAAETAKPKAQEVVFWKEAAAAAIGGSIHALIEQPITTPIEAAITQTQVNGILVPMLHTFHSLYPDM